MRALQQRSLWQAHHVLLLALITMMLLVCFGADSLAHRRRQPEADTVVLPVVHVRP